MPLPCSQIPRDVTGAIVAEQTWFVDNMNLVAARGLQSQSICTIDKIVDMVQALVEYLPLPAHTIWAGRSVQSPIGFGPESLDKRRIDVLIRLKFSLTSSGRFLAAPAANISTIAMYTRRDAEGL